MAIYTADLITIFALLFFGSMGYSRGLANEVLDTLNWILGIFFVVLVYPPLVEFLGRHMNSPVAAHVLTGFIIFVIVVWFLGKLKSLAKALIKSGNMVQIDKTLGGVFGMAKGFFLLLIAYIFLAVFYPSQQFTWIEKSYVKPYYDKAAVFMIHHIPSLGELDSAFGVFRDPSEKDGKSNDASSETPLTLEEELFGTEDQKPPQTDSKPEQPPMNTPPPTKEPRVIYMPPEPQASPSAPPKGDLEELFPEEDTGIESPGSNPGAVQDLRDQLPDKEDLEKLEEQFKNNTQESRILKDPFPADRQSDSQSTPPQEVGI